MKTKFADLPKREQTVLLAMADKLAPGIQPEEISESGDSGDILLEAVRAAIRTADETK